MTHSRFRGGRRLAVFVAMAVWMVVLQPADAATKVYNFIGLGRLEADQFSDVVVSSRISDRIQIEGRDGNTGSLLWATDSNPITAHAMGDLTGDGIAEVVVVRTVLPWISTPSPPLNCISVSECLGRREFGMELAAVSGIDGSLLWRLRLPFPQIELNYSVLKIGDVTSDGLSDLYVTAVALNRAQQGGIHVPVAHGIAVQGISGSILGGIMTEGALAVVPDMSADGKPDVVTFGRVPYQLAQSGPAPNGQNQYSISAWDVTGTRLHWSKWVAWSDAYKEISLIPATPRGPNSIALLVMGDVSPLGHPIQGDWRFYATFDRSGNKKLSGAIPRPLYDYWLDRTPGVYIAGDANGDGSDDLHMEPAPFETGSVEARDGRTGALIWSRSGICMCPSHDVTGDGVRDILSGGADSRAVWDGKTGATVWESTGRLAYPLNGDLNGNGINDFTYRAGSPLVHFYLEGQTGEQLPWTPGVDNPTHVADMNPSEGKEILQVTSYQYGDYLRPRYADDIKAFSSANFLWGLR